MQPGLSGYRRHSRVIAWGGIHTLYPLWPGDEKGRGGQDLVPQLWTVPKRRGIVTPDKQALFDLADRLSEARVLVVGDLMLDRFIWGKVNRISPEAPVPVVQVTSDSIHLGGAANVVSNINALGGRAVPIGLIGNDEAGNLLRKQLAQGNMSQQGIVADGDFQTIEKTRIIAHHQQVVRVDRERLINTSETMGTQIKAKLSELIPRAQAVIVSDYGKGVVNRGLLQHLCQFRDQVFISVDPKDLNFDHYRQVHVITPNQSEAERMSGVTIDGPDSLEKAAAAIFKRLSCKHLLITLGEHGMALFRGSARCDTIPTLAREIYDVSGAGDTVIAVYTMAQAVGADPHQAALMANAAAGVVVGKLGTATLDKEELKTALGAMI